MTFALVDGAPGVLAVDDSLASCPGRGCRRCCLEVESRLARVGLFPLYTVAELGNQRLARGIGLVGLSHPTLLRGRD